MPEVIRWSVIGGSLVFIVGLVSAIGSRKSHEIIIERLDDDETREQPAKKPPVYVVISGAQAKANTEPTTAMSMAASGGQLNGEESLAPVGNHSR